MNQDFYQGLLSGIVFDWGSDMSVYTSVANNYTMAHIRTNIMVPQIASIVRIFGSHNPSIVPEATFV